MGLRSAGQLRHRHARGCPRVHAANGMMLIYSVFAMTAMLMLASLAVDYGRVQLAKTEMQCAVDAAARAATAYLPADTAGARTQAISVAAMHTVDGQALVLQSGDIVFGKWDTTTLTLDTASGTPDAVRISAQRTVSRGTPITLTLTKVVGFNNFDLTYSATVTGTPGTANYGILGLNSVNMSSAAFTGTYNSTASTTSTGSSSTDGDVAGNNTITLSSDVSIGGTVYYNTASAPTGGSYFAAKTKMPAAAVTPATPSAGSYTSSNNNANIGLPTSGANANYSGSGTMSVPGGNYVLNSVNISGLTIQFTGATTIWMYGGVSMSGASMLAYQNKPANLQIKFCSSAGFNLANSTIYGVITAPTATANITASSHIYGSIVVSDLNVAASSIYYDSQLGNNGPGTSTGSTLVK